MQAAVIHHFTFNPSPHTFAGNKLKMELLATQAITFYLLDAGFSSAEKGILNTYC